MIGSIFNYNIVENCYSLEMNMEANCSRSIKYYVCWEDY